MPLRVVQSLSLADQVFAQLGEEILSGRYLAGTQIPAERKLVETFGVNRHVVREAIKRLEQMGLVEVSQGGGTTVLDYVQTAGLDLLALMAEHAQVHDDAMRYWLAVHEMRAVVSSDAARLCALRASQAERDAILAVAEEMKSVGDGPELFRLDLRFWGLVHEGARNVAYRLAFNTMIKGVTAPPVVELASQWDVHEVKECGYRMAIGKAIAAGDAKGAEAASRESMRRVVQVLEDQVLGGTVRSRPSREIATPALHAVQERRVKGAKVVARKQKAAVRAARRQ